MREHRKKKKKKKRLFIHQPLVYAPFLCQRRVGKERYTCQPGAPRERERQDARPRTPQ